MLNDYDAKRAGARIRKWQKESGLTGVAIAREAGISSAYYSDIWKGYKPGSVDKLSKVLRVFGKTLGDLIAPEPGQAQDTRDIIGAAIAGRLPEGMGLEDVSLVFELLDLSDRAGPEFRQCLKCLVDVGHRLSDLQPSASSTPKAAAGR